MNSSGLLLPHALRSAHILPKISQLPELQSGAITRHHMPLHSTPARATTVQPASNPRPRVLFGKAAA